jgi:hypothetical protein
MIYKNSFSKDYKEKIVLELIPEQSCLALVSQREKANS